MTALAKESFIDFIDVHLANEETRLPVFDKTSLSIRNELEKDDPDMQRVERLIVSDQGLTTHLLSIANSAFYRGLQKVTTVRQALVRIGAEEMSHMVMMAAVRNTFACRKPFYRKVFNKLWKHSVACGIGANWLTRRCGFRSIATESFTSGLLHDIGKLFLLAALETVQETDGGAVDVSDALATEILDTLHTEYGYTLLQKWNLPETYCRIARDHHRQDFDDKDLLLAIVRLVNLACNNMRLGLRAPQDCFLAATPEAHLLNLSEIDIAELEIKLEDSVALAG